MHVRIHTPLGRHAPWADPPWTDTPRVDTPQQTATAADGTHPTGMHSCLINYNYAKTVGTSGEDFFNVLNGFLVLAEIKTWIP